MQIAADLMPVKVPEYVQHEVSAQQVSIFLARNRHAAAQLALQKWGFSFHEKFSFPALPDGNRISYSVGLLFNSGLRIIAKQAQAKDDLATGLTLADDLIARAAQSQQVLIMLEALLLRAQIYATLGDQSKSQADYLRALGLAEPEGFIGIFVEQDPVVAKALADLIRDNQLGTIKTDYVERILAAFSQSGFWRAERGHFTDNPEKATQSTPAALIEPLSDREADVLRLMAEGLKYREIAECLMISLNTVRSHTKSIYGKLGVRNRTRAIEEARQLRIL
jgi:LuxR family maltose regulon positive regulatory protein